MFFSGNYKSAGIKVLGLVCGACILGTAGCAPSQSMHHSGQIGRFYGGGVSFSVPLETRQERAGGEDTFWEIRQGIGNALVVAYAPAREKFASFRENITVTEQKLDPRMTAEAFREHELDFFGKEGQSLGKVTRSQDAAGLWAQFDGRDASGRELVHKAWFFVHPSADGSSALGVVMLGTVLNDADSIKRLDDFYRVALTVSFARPQSGFAKLLGQLDLVADTSLGIIAPAPQSPAVTTPASPVDAAAQHASPNSVEQNAPTTLPAQPTSVASPAAESPVPAPSTAAPSAAADSPAVATEAASPAVPATTPASN